MRDKSLAKRIGKLLRQLRQSTGMSQEMFADQCGLHRTYIGAIERGEKVVTVETARKITAALGLSLSEFFTQLEQETTA